MLITAAADTSRMEAIEIVELPAQAVLGLRRRGPYARIPEMLMEVFGVIMEKGAIPAGPPIFICHEASMEAADRATATGDADLEVVFPVANRVKPAGDVAYYDLPGGRFAKTRHQGPYEECRPTYERLFAWLAGQGLSIAGPIREAYLNDPAEVAPGEILTEIYVPVG